MRQNMGVLALVTQLGITMALSIIFGVLLGIWVDSRLGTKPFGILVFSLLGIIAGTIAVYRLVARSIEEAEQSYSSGETHESKPDDRE